MTVEVKLPELGENIESADVIDVLVAEGDVVAKDQDILEAETEKAAVPIPSSAAGKIVKVHVKKGDTIKVGQVMITVEQGAAESPPKKAGRGSGKKGKPTKQEPPAASVPDTVRPPASTAATPTTPQAPATPSPAPSPTATTAVAAAPSVRQFAREIGVDIRSVAGSGPGGRITEDDVKLAARSRGPAAAVPGGPGRVSREAMSKIRKVTAAHMTRCWQIPHVTIHDKADVTDLEAERQRYKARAEAAGGRLTITAMTLKIVASALKVYPNLNASIDMERNEIEHHHYVNVGVAVSTDAGLVVPVVRDVDQKNILELATALTELSAKARDRKLRPDDMSGGTFTVTNLGSIGTGFFTPIINSPEVGILGMGRALREPVYEDGQFQPRLMMPLSLSFDHRLVDGAEAALFLRWIVEAVQNPLLLSLEG